MCVYVCIVFLYKAAHDQLVVINVLCYMYILIYIKFQGPLQDNETLYLPVGNYLDSQYFIRTRSV